MSPEFSAFIISFFTDRQSASSMLQELDQDRTFLLNQINFIFTSRCEQNRKQYIIDIINSKSSGVKQVNRND